MSGGTLPDPLPGDFVEVRNRLHVLAHHVITPARYRVTGRIGLRAWDGVWGTPPFEQDGSPRRVWVDADRLVVESDGQQRSQVLTTLGEAAQLVLGRSGGDLRFTEDLELHDKPPLSPPDTDLSVDARTAGTVAGWFNLAFDVLAALREDEASQEDSEPQLWPEHFDPAIECLPAPRRASYGFSPGHPGHEEPYAYVQLWSPEELAWTPGEGPWNAEGFAGAELRAAEFLGGDDPAATALAWLRARRDDLAALSTAS